MPTAAELAAAERVERLHADLASNGWSRHEHAEVLIERHCLLKRLAEWRLADVNLPALLNGLCNAHIRAGVVR